MIQAESAVAAAPLKHGTRVFVVDDAQIVRKLIIECLKEVPGLEVAGVAGSEETALEWLRSNSCEVMILDLELRRGTGIGLLKALAASDIAPGLVKIVYSNHADEATRQTALRLGAAHVFDKTMDVDNLRLLLQKIASTGA